MTPEDWIAHDPDPVTAAELHTCSAEELAARFAAPLRFGTAGLRGPVRGGPDAMNLAVVLRASWAVAQVLLTQGRAGSTVVVGGDARHGSALFSTATAEVLAAAGFSAQLMPGPCPTPVVAYAVRHSDAAAGIQITASHNPATDNGYKVFFDGGIQIVSPADTAIETAMAQAPPADAIPRCPVTPAGDELIARYIERAATVRRHRGGVRVALTPLHGVGGAFALRALRAAGFTDVHVVESQFDPDPDFPTVAFPNPEEPGATDALLALAGEVDADIAIALDPDADRCAIGVGSPGGWRMLTGNETGWLLGDYLLSQLPPDREAAAVVASSVVSSRMLAHIAASYGAHHVQTLTGFKWLARADDGLPGATLVYAYEEAIGYCVDPDAVRDKDGISAAVLACDLVSALRDRGSSIPEALDELACCHGVHVTDAVTRRVDSPAAAAAVMARLRADPPGTLAGFTVAATDLLHRRGPNTDALEFTGERDGTSVRVVVRPSGTEPKLKCYLEVTRPPSDDLAGDRAEAQRVCAAVADAARSW
ncbi:phospho-sugar mutase [Mycolicibacter hiberniae]|uniref:Phosphomannomutase n=1 Tax=Mycolicibacter hiberniae TaxID=29314 RepID=A0A7I7X3Q1_9MYCO|nr:phospho-sugar mutase [Mycolicibacter hiberniae]MCV7086019.1 phospho-sugar mutase [Mycolicibacter hiberniae]ORV70590.1 phosphomannomutase [Mycolicibacter hiberniae]BBZ24132.1 phosphomannomutase [Mycolicibacter hiberniae]